MARSKIGMTALVVAALVGGTAATAQAQVGLESNTATVTLNATREPGITISTSSSALTLASITDNSVLNAFGGFTVTTYYTLNAGASVALVGYFDNAAAALANAVAGDNIPSSAVEASVNGGAYSAFTGGVVGAVGVAGASRTLDSWAVGAGSYTNTQSTPVALRLNLTGAKTTTMVGDYAGTLNLRAVVQ